MDYKQLFKQYLYSQFSDDIMYEEIKYILFGRGNYIRPQLLLAWCDYCGGDVKNALPLALAVECVHVMSLIHDDLPCMDNETIRRGQLPLHKKSSEAIALLCGDKLLAKAFTIIMQSELSQKQKNLAVTILSEASCDMADGQYLEFTSPKSKDNLYKIHTKKTASLISAACSLGAVASEAPPSEIHLASEYGRNLGMMYQIIDDLKDEDGLFLSLTECEIKNTCLDLKKRTESLLSKNHSFLSSFLEGIFNETFSNNS